MTKKPLGFFSLQVFPAALLQQQQRLQQQATKRAWIDVPAAAMAAELLHEVHISQIKKVLTYVVQQHV
jgi:hypothetical protein